MVESSSDTRKSKGHQDDMKRVEDLMQSEYLNILYNSRAKELIKIEQRIEIAFLFVLLLGYVTSINYKTVLNYKESIKLVISLATLGSYIQNKFKSNFQLN